jgi:4-hydroxythreonine-4-phosphate dehydrogenase
VNQTPRDLALPTIGVTIGDPCGIGPEVAVKALADPSLWKRARVVIYGSGAALDEAAERCGIEPYWFRIAADSPRASQAILTDVTLLDWPEHTPSAGPSRASGLAAKTFVEAAIADAMLAAGTPRRLDAIVTGPVSKEAWHLAGFRWPGHTELLAHRTKAKRHAMAFVSPRLRVAVATTHVPLMELRNVLTIGRVFDPIDLGHQFCRRLGIGQPRIAVCGVNPHAGEGGIFGDEEIRVVGPAIEAAKRAGIDASGPWPGDTVFIDALAGRFDLVVAMYHDQGLIPLKLLDRDRSVNVTLGLPIVRTSPDHGTAFDIAGRGVADPGSMRAAIDLAAQLAACPDPAEVVPAFG